VSNFSASIPVAQMAAANDLLANKAGTPGKPNHGPNCFSVPAYNGANPGFALLHAWADPVFEASVAAIPGVVIQQAIITPVQDQTDSVNNDPSAMTAKVAQTVGATWGSDAKPLTGSVTPGLYKDAAGVLWWVIQSYNTATYPDPTIIPALIRRARVPGEVSVWVQPLDQFGSYYATNPFTGKPDMVTHSGFTWKSLVDTNVWIPGGVGTEALWVKA
jgi:hypothetical protein